MAQPTLAVIDGNSAPQTIYTINPNGQATMANSQPVVIASNQSAVPVTAAGIPAALGQATMANSQPVVIASDQGDVAVTPCTPIINGAPSAQSLAATGTVQFAVTGNTTVALTVTNAPAATASWAATVGFQWSPDGSTWNTLTATPKASLPGASAVQASSTTAPGLWLATLPANAAWVRYNVTAYTSGTIWFFVEPWNQTNAVVQIPWSPSVTSGNTIAGWIDTSGFTALLVRVSSVTTTVLTVQGTNDPTGTDVATIAVQDTGGNTSSGSTTITAAGSFRANLQGFKWVRVQVTTTGTVETIQGITAITGPANATSSYGSSVFVTGSNLSSNVAQIGGTTTVTGGVSGTLAVGGNVAISSAATCNPLGVGGRVMDTTMDTTLIDGDVNSLWISPGKQLLIKPYASAGADWQFNGTVTTSTQTAVKAAGAASIRNYVTSITYQNTNATATTLTIQDGSSTLVTFSCAASMANPVQLTFPTPLKGTAATAVNYTAGTTGANVLLNVTGYQSP